ncbi:TlpA family protein disulfide reductase [Polaribacter sp. Asnod1-A03]|uniref:TlpA family protein disulfide reductase n=1 Tax=Polaribacter sp. Asnod1-A03 TaxID=3160581 RepID=UPI003866F627
MKRTSLILLTSILLISCKKKEAINIENISKKFNSNVENIDKIKYNGQLKMQLSDGNVSEYNGVALIEKEPNDTIFGFSFYGIRTNIDKATIYKNGVGFLISTEDNKFKSVDPEPSLLGRYGGPIIYKDFFKLENVYKNVKVSETEDSFILDYVFEDDLKNKITQKTKKLELDKKNFLPKKVTTSLQPDFGDKQTIVYVFENLKTNENIEKNINEYIQDLNKFELIKEENPKPNALLKKSLPAISLKNLFNENEMVAIKTDKITLIDFWEVWCGPCIASFPKVEDLKNKFSSNLNIVGIVSEDKENAVKLVNKKGTTFLNLIGDKELKEAFSVNSLPRYFLIDKNGIIQKEYHGFSDQIEKNIEELIRK